MSSTVQRSLLVFLLVFSFAASGGQSTDETAFDMDRAEIVEFVNDLVTNEGFDRQFLIEVLSRARFQPRIVESISKPAERTLTWAEYRRIFMTLSRISSGAEFMDEHQEVLMRASERYGVPPEMITAIIGVETLYGRYLGRYRVLDALMTLGFDYPPRSRFFRSELKEFLLLTREEKQDPSSPLGSYAGAMGYGQFISSSYRNYAVDFDGDGIRDIWTNKTDAIGSVANYLSRHGWQAGRAVTVKLSGPGQAPGDLFNQGLKASSTLGEFATVSGIPIPGAFESDTPVSPMRLVGEDGEEFWLGLPNFYVITRYNHSHLYAMAVYQLSQAIADSVEGP